MVARIALIFIALIPFTQVQSQDFVQKSRINAHGTIAPGFSLYDMKGTVSLQGQMEYFIHEKVSIRGDVFWFVDYLNSDDPGFLDDKAALFSGITYHFAENKHLNPYVALQPGIGMARTIFYSTTGNVSFAVMDNSYHFFPMASVALGTYYYANNWFYFFGEVRGSTGKYFSPFDVKEAGELQFSFGLGFSLLTKKNKD